MTNSTNTIDRPAILINLSDRGSNSGRGTVYILVRVVKTEGTPGAKGGWMWNLLNARTGKMRTSNPGRLLTSDAPLTIDKIREFYDLDLAYVEGFNWTDVSGVVVDAIFDKIAEPTPAERLRELAREVIA